MVNKGNTEKDSNLTENMLEIINSIAEKIKKERKTVQEDVQVSYGDIIDYINENCPETPLYQKIRTYCYQKLRNVKCYEDSFLKGITYNEKNC